MNAVLKLKLTPFWCTMMWLMPANNPRTFCCGNRLVAVYGLAAVIALSFFVIELLTTVSANAQRSTKVVFFVLWSRGYRCDWPFHQPVCHVQPITVPRFLYQHMLT